MANNLKEEAIENYHKKEFLKAMQLLEKAIQLFHYLLPNPIDYNWRDNGINDDNYILIDNRKESDDIKQLVIKIYRNMQLILLIEKNIYHVC